MELDTRYLIETYLGLEGHKVDFFLPKIGFLKLVPSLIPN